MKSRLCALLVPAALLIAGCGSSGSGAGQAGDPAKLVPASALVYVDAAVRPDGTLHSDADAAMKKLLHTNDPDAKVVGLFNKAAAHGHVSWEDLKPWLGQRVGLFLTAVGPGKNATQGALVADTTDTGKARDAFPKLERSAGLKSAPTTQTYRGVSLRVDSADDTAWGIVGDSAVVGSLSGVHQVIDVSKGARPLSDVADFTNAETAVKADESLVSAYVVPKGLLAQVGKYGAGAGTSAGLGSARMLSFLRQAASRSGRAEALSLHADGGAVRVRTAAIGAPAGSSGTAAADELAGLPADAWLGIGFGPVGSALSRELNQFSSLSSLSSHGMNFNGVLARFQKRSGINVRRDLLSWMGGGAVYARGTGLTDIGGALTINSTNPAKSQRAVAVIGRGLVRAGLKVQRTTVPGYTRAIQVSSSQVPVSVFVAAGGTHFSIGINPQAMSDVINPSTKLGASAAYASATKALGGDVKPVFLLDAPTIVGLLDTFVGGNPAYAKVKSYLDALGPMSAGTARDGDTALGSFALTLR